MTTLSTFGFRELLREKGRRRIAHRLLRTAVTCSFVVMLAALLPPKTFAQSDRDVDAFFRQDIGLSEEQIADIRKGTPVVKAMPSRTPAEVFLFGAIYVHADPETYIAFKHDFDRRRDLPNYVALGVFSRPPQAMDLNGFTFGADDIDSLKQCRPGDCLVQMPATSMEGLQQFDWSSAGASGRINQQLREEALRFLRDYQRYGNRVLGTYNDKRHPTDVMRQFAYMLSYSTALPARLAGFYNYLLHYPDAKPPNVDDTFYWEHVKFGLKPTLRMVQLTTLRGQPGDNVACAIAEKQLYSSHYFETALDLSFCIRGKDEAQPGFFLITALASEQEGLTGVKGSIVRKAAVGRSVSSLQNALRTVRTTLEGDHNGHAAR